MKIYMATIKMQVPSGQHAQSTKQTHITPYWPLSRLASCQQILTVTGAKCMARCCSWCQPGKLLIGCHPFWLQWEGTLHPLFNLSRNRCRNGDFLAIFCVLYFQRAMCSTFQTCILNSKATTFGSMVDIQPVTAEIGRGKKKKKERKIETTGQNYNGLPYSIEQS